MSERNQFEFCEFVVPDVKTDTLAHVIAEKYPQVWARTYTKHYEAPGIFRSFKYVAVQFSMGFIADALRRSAPGKEIVSNLPILFKLLEEYDWPTYHVHASMLTAMQRTHPPAGKTWDDIMLPYPGVIFMLPQGSMYMPPISGLEVQHTEKIPLVYIGIARIKRTRFKFRSEYGENDGSDRMCVFWSSDTPNGPISHDCCFPTSQQLEPDPDWINKATLAQEYEGHLCEGLVDGKYSAALAGVIANLLLLREARPEYTEAGRPTGKHLGNGVKIHKPTFIGRRYVTRTLPGMASTSTGKFTEIGWRAGHMKEQPCGPKLMQRKTIWVEPYMAHVRGLEITDKDADNSTETR